MINKNNMNTYLGYKCKYAKKCSNPKIPPVFGDRNPQKTPEFWD